MDLQFGSLKDGLCVKAAAHDLQRQKTGGVASVEQQHVWQRGPKAEPHTAVPREEVRLLSSLPAPSVLMRVDFDVDESRSREGEGGRRGATVVKEAVLAQAGVAVLIAAQPGQAGGSVQAVVVHAAVELDVAAVSSPGELASGHDVGTVADVGGQAVLAPASVEAWLALTLVYVDLTEDTWGDATYACC